MLIAPFYFVISLPQPSLRNSPHCDFPLDCDVSLSRHGCEMSSSNLTSALEENGRAEFLIS
jgi:hypothetical protein